ncbi:hypothetical protein E4O00_07935 [Treponema sp. OMZ 788]|uniref:hypothetical protein n=1 Tax=unclassified Treponema TaxID=2638727 RepID=UPI0020A5C1BA|nr:MULTISPECIES: hypothetical protein [unclassified Treponema]UTC63334.1 hypothetical protein E4O05_05465 [Treponema sp. OMZ 787]UTC63846.1 hypothetical protein E4O00_07935 [Treponema sp. OMZ 788]
MNDLMVIQKISSEVLTPIFHAWISTVESNNKRTIELARINSDLKKAIHSISKKGHVQRTGIIACQNCIISAINNSSLPNELKRVAISEGYNAIREIAGL